MGAVRAQWFGRPSARAADFTTEGCQNVSLSGVDGRRLQLYRDPPLQGCQVHAFVYSSQHELYHPALHTQSSATWQASWLDDGAYLHLQAALAGGSGGWTLSLPKAASGPASVQCMGPRGPCLVQEAPPCVHASGPPQAVEHKRGAEAALSAGEVTVQSVQNSASCSAGQPSPDLRNGASLLYGLQVTVSAGAHSATQPVS